MASINAMEEGRRKLQQIVAEQVEKGIRDALGADTASLIENQAARIRDLEAELAVLREADRLINDPSNNYDWHDAIEATRAKEPER